MAVPERSKLAVMFTDVVGFTSIMEHSESSAMDILTRVDGVLRSRLHSNSGSLVKVMGDGTLSVFPTPPQAVSCARELQDSLAGDEFRLRVGIHWGDVLHDRGDVFGDTVNVASRLEKVAAPGGICISGEMLNNFSDEVMPDVKCLGLHKLKGLGRLIELYTVCTSRPCRLTQPSVSAGVEISMPPRESSVPSVAVSLLDNLGEEKDSFYAYGISSDLVSDLSRAGNINVVPLSEVIPLQDSPDLGSLLLERFDSRFLVRGSLWKEKSVFRLSVELRDLRENRLLWTDNWQDDWYELPSIKGKLADSLLKVIGIKPSEFPGLTATETDEANSYELYLKGRHDYHRRTSSEDLKNSRSLIARAIELDPDLVSARVLLAETFRDTGELSRGMEILEEALDTARKTGNRVGQLQALNGIGVNLWKQSNLSEAGDALRESLEIAGEIGDRDGEAKAMNNLGLIEWNQGRLKEALSYLRGSLAIAEEMASCRQQTNTLCNIGLVYTSEGNVELAIDYYRRSLDLAVSSGNLDTQAHVMINLANAHFRNDEVEKAFAMGERCLEICRELSDRPGQCRSLCNMGNVMLHLGCFDDAENYYRQADVIATDQDDIFMKGVIQSGLGLLECQRGNVQAGIALYRDSLSICREMEDAEGESELLFQIGEALLLLGDFPKAAEVLRDALRILESIGSTNRRAALRLYLAFALLSAVPSDEELKEALDQLDPAVSELETLHRRDEPDIMMALADIYRLMMERPEHLHEADDLSMKYRKAVSAAWESLKSSADGLESAELRTAFLENIERHREIAAAYAEFNPE